MSNKKQGAYTDIPLSSNPVVFRFRVANDAIDNVTVFTGEQAEYQRAVACDASNVRVVDQEDWEQYGYEIRRFEGQDVLHKKWDYTEAKLKQEQQKAQKLEDAPDTVGDLKEHLKQKDRQLDQLQAMVEKLLNKGSDALDAEEHEAAAKAKETAELDTLAGIDDTPKSESEDTTELEDSGNGDDAPLPVPAPAKKKPGRPKKAE